MGVKSGTPEGDVLGDRACAVALFAGGNLEVALDADAEEGAGPVILSSDILRRGVAFCGSGLDDTMPDEVSFIA